MKQKPQKRRTKRSPVRLLPPRDQLEQLRKGLPKFKPHDLRELVRKPQADKNAKTREAAFIDVLRSENDKQLLQLLRSMGLDETSPNAWQRAFFLLATMYCGIGHLAWRPVPTNKNASKWRSTHDLTLIHEMIRLTGSGLSERAALKALAGNPRKRQLFPYRAQKYRHYPKASAEDRCYAALRARWQKIKDRKLVNAFGQLNPDAGIFEEVLSHLDSTVGG
jgi:hypothetical protein